MCPHLPKQQYPTEEAMPGPGEFCEECRRWVSTVRAKPVSVEPSAPKAQPRCAVSVQHYKSPSSAANARTHNRIPGLIVECACGGFVIAPPLPEPPKPKIDLEAARRSCFSKKGYYLELATKLAEERGLRAYACNYCGRFHLTKQPLRGA